jgi:UV DNA damage repair endonuclease
VDPGDARDLLASLEGVGPVDVMLEAKDKERALLELRDALGVEEATS